MATANRCGRCGNPYAGSFDNALLCEHCRHDNRGWPLSIGGILLLLVVGLLILAGAIWLIGVIF